MAVTAGVDLHHPLKLPHSIHPSRADCNGFMGATRTAIARAEVGGKRWFLPASFDYSRPAPVLSARLYSRADVYGERWFLPASFDYSRPAP